MSIAEQYLSAPQYAERRGSSEPTLKKLVEQAKGTQHDIGEHAAEYGGTKVWHISKWEGLEEFRLKDAIDEAVKLGFVMTSMAADEFAVRRYNEGYKLGYETGVEDGALKEE